MVHVRVDLASLSHTGKVRPVNEDHFMTARYGRSIHVIQSNLPPSALPERFDQNGYGLVVADGIGGAAAGEIASRMAIAALFHLVLQTPDWILAREPEYLIETIKKRMKQRLQSISDAIADQSQRDEDLQGMGTTMTLAVTLADFLLIVHVGDSRAYLLRRGQLLRLTRDQTIAQQLADEGVIPVEEVASHRLRNVLTQSLGSGVALGIESRTMTLQDGDRLLLCTDGLTDMVDDAAIAAALQSAPSADTACRSLVDQALAAGGRDNVTVAIARFHVAANPPAAAKT